MKVFICVKDIVVMVGVTRVNMYLVCTSMQPVKIVNVLSTFPNRCELFIPESVCVRFVIRVSNVRNVSRFSLVYV